MHDVGAQTDPTAELQAEVLSWDSRKSTETFDHRSCESVAFTDRRQLYKLGRSASSAPKIDEARAELLDTNGVLRIPISPSADDEFPQSRHLGEGRSHVLSGGAGSGDSNLGRRDNDAV